MCENMKWSHLPLAGGLFDQDPDLLDGFRVIWHERAEHESAEAKKREKEMGQKTPRRRGASRSRR